MLEIWKDIKGYEGKYQISNFGRVKRLSRKMISKYFILKVGRDRTIEKILVNNKNNVGYTQVGLGDGEKMKIHAIHRLVAEHFIENEDNKPQVNHKNGIKDDNNVKNIEWVTASENGLHSYRVLGHKAKKLFGEDNHRSKKVVQKTVSGRIVKIWNAMNEAHRKEGFDSGSICHCCNGEAKTHKGFIWEYYDAIHQKYVMKESRL